VQDTSALHTCPLRLCSVAVVAGDPWSSASGLTVMPRGVKKENLPTKVCVTCNRPFTWRKKWEKCWDEVTTCSKSCNAARRKAKQDGKKDDTDADSDSGEAELPTKGNGKRRAKGSSRLELSVEKLDYNACSSTGRELFSHATSEDRGRPKTSNPCGEGPETQGRLENLLGSLRLSSGASPLAGVAAKGSGEHRDSGEAELPRRGADWQGGVSHLFCGMCPHTDNTGIRGPFLQNLLTASTLQLGATSAFSRPALP
jgi:hypothetical protein